LHVDEDGNASLPVTVTKSKDMTGPGTVTGIQSTVVSPANEEMRITWTDPDESSIDARDRDFNHVLIEWDIADATGLLSATVNRGVLSFINANLYGYKAYTFKVYSVDDDGNKTYCGLITKAKETIPPGNVTITGLTEGNARIIFTWTNPADADFDHVEITWLPGGTSVNAASKTDLGYTATGLVNGTEYAFSIVSVDLAGNKSSPCVIKATPSGTEKINYLIYTADDLNAVRGANTDPKYAGWGDRLGIYGNRTCQWYRVCFFNSER